MAKVSQIAGPPNLYCSAEGRKRDEEKTTKKRLIGLI